ncbi:MAG: phosphatase PAP2 family protein [Thermoguttaceae bacterium]
MSNAGPRYRWLVLPGLLLAAAVVALLAVDMPVARGLNQLRQDAATNSTARLVLSHLRGLGLFEVFGHGLGVLLAALMIYQLDVSRRWAIPRVLVCAFAAGVMADLVKMTLMRFRPHGLHFPFAGDVWNTFGDWWPALGVSSDLQSFPSAHMATAVGLAAALVWLYPRGRIVFPLLAVLVGFQRIAAGAHYPSDVLVGAAVGCLVGALLLNVGPLPVWFEKWERRWGAPVRSASCEINTSARRGT